MGLFAESGNDPLTDVSTQVENQITDAVGVLVCSPPDFRIREQLNAGSNFWQAILDEMLDGLLRKGLWQRPPQLPMLFELRRGVLELLARTQLQRKTNRTIFSILA